MKEQSQREPERDFPMVSDFFKRDLFEGCKQMLVVLFSMQRKSYPIGIGYPIGYPMSLKGFTSKERQVFFFFENLVNAREIRCM